MLRVERIEDGAYWEVEIGDGKGNILDAGVLDGITELFHEAHDAPSLKAIGFRGHGKHFSFGASVEEHLPEQVGAMLPRFHEMFRAMHASRVVCLASVRGQCLGGGFELASFCHRVFASPDAKFGQPEIVLGVYAPIASLLLTERVSRAHAEDLCFSGRSVSTDDALAMGLVDEVDEDPVRAASDYAKKNLLPHSASSLRFAVQAARHGFGKRLAEELPEIERVYLEELMATEDAKEGIRAFVDKRTPEWSDR